MPQVPRCGPKPTPKINRAPSRWFEALLCALLWQPAVQALAACELRQMEIPLRMVNQRPIATITLNGTPVSMLVDSGAFFSMLSASTAEQLNLTLRFLPPGVHIGGYTGRVQAKRTRVEKVGLRGVELSRVEFLVGGNELGAGIQGVLGRNILSMGDAEYDLAHGVVRLIIPKGDCDKTNFAYWAGEAPVVVVPLEDRHGSSDTPIEVEVGINGKRTLALLDTGAPQTSLTLRVARRAGIGEGDLVPAGRVGGAGDGRAKSWSAPVALFELGGEKIANNRLRLNDVESDEHGMLIGLDYFLSHRIYVSRLQRQVYITWNGGAVFAQNQAAGQDDARYAAVPEELPDDNADALARRGAAFLAAKNYARALEDLNRACALAPGVADHFDSRARVRLALREPRQALADMDEALRLKPDLVEARIRRAQVRDGLGDQPGAQADLVQLDGQLPSSAAQRADMAALWAHQGQVPEALRQFGLWEASHPRDARLASVLNSRCWLRTRMNIELKLALQDCEAAVDKDDGAAAHRDSLGWTYLRLGDAERAKKAFDGALKHETLALSLFGRGLALQRLNQPDLAERDLAAARKLHPQIDAQLQRLGFDFAAGNAP